MSESKDRYFISVQFNGKTIEEEVTLEEYCKAERAAGFRPKMASDEPGYWTTPATAGFSGYGRGGRIEYGK